MFQTHCYDAWLSAEARKTTFFMYSQIGGTLPAPLFLFLAGISFALTTGKLIQKGLGPGQIARTTIRRGAEIFALGLLFRLQEYLIAWGWAPWSDLFRVDILNTIGVSMMLMGILCWMVLALRGSGNLTSRLAIAAAGSAMAIALLTPPLWTNGDQTGCLGRSNPTSMAFTTWEHRKPGCFRFFPGLPSHLPGLRWDSGCRVRGQNFTRALPSGTRDSRAWYL